MPDLSKSRPFLDFGKGFYLTANESQAIEFSHKIAARAKRLDSDYTGCATVSTFEFDLAAADSLLSVKRFMAADEQWLDFIIDNRTGKGKAVYDVIIGPVANDDVYQVIEKYEDGTLTKKQAIAAFKVKNLFNQYTLCSDAAVKLLRFVSSKEYAEESKNGI